MASCPGLLVSVRTADEAEMAVSGGADIVDVKDPVRGPLGMAHHQTVSAILEQVGGRVPVSAALGEWSSSAMSEAHWHLGLPLRYVKWGLAELGRQEDWAEPLLETRRQLPTPEAMVCVAYADHTAAKSPSPQELVKFAKRYRFQTFLFDTFQKDGRTLLDHLSVDELRQMIDNLKRSKVQVALAGSLKIGQLKSLKQLGATWLAVRGAVCVGGTRDGELDPVRLKKWRAELGAKQKQ